MLKIRALNRDSLSDEDAPTIRKEAQEEIALDLYNKALRLQCDGKLEKSEEILQQLLDENIPQLESQGGLPKTMSTLKYSCYTNLGSNAKERGDLQPALENYLMASELDGTDVTLWYKIGILALKVDKFRQAAYAFSQGLECNESHWPCLDKLIVVLYAIRDTIGCLFYITKALVLDPDYTRGLVLRKQIYEANPATREYYQLYNPDYILEPDLDVKIEGDDEKECMEDVEKLCERINEVEKSLTPKPLPCIALPTPLDEYTWLSLGRTLTDLHRYISNNKMSHFCKVDLSKCMSQTGIEKPAVPEPVPPDCPVENQTKEAEPKIEAKPAQPPEIENKMELEQNVERRMSLNSDHNGDVNDSAVENLNSSQAEDNDEMDQDTEDQEENIEQKTDKKRGTKRRRDLLLDLQVWGWHSKRKSAKKSKSEKDLTVEDALKRIVPSRLLPNGLQVEKYNSHEDSMNTVDIYKMFVERQATVACLSPIHSPNPCDGKEEYFGSQQEKDDVLKFWTKQWTSCDAISLIEEFVHILASFWHYKWPPKLIPIYIDSYNMYREHFEHPPLFSASTTFVALKNDALATLLYGELFLYQAHDKEMKFNEVVHPTSLSHLQMLSAWEQKWGEDHALFFIRVHWLRAHIFRKSVENSLAIRSLQLVHEVILAQEEKTETIFRLFFPNCGKYSFITSELTEKLLKHLEMIDSLSRLEQLYNSKCYPEVAEILQTTFMCIGNPPTCGRMGRPAQLGMLMDSLWYTNKTDCFIWTEKSLHEAVGYFVKPLKDQDKWEMVLNKCLAILHEIIKEETVSIVDVLSEDQRCRLIQSLCRTVCRQLNMEGTSNLPLGSVIPWIVMHSVLLREEHREQAKRVVSHVKKKRKSNSFSESEPEEVRERQVPASIAILFSAHDFLGPKGWCLTSQGELLHFTIDNILDRLDTPIFEPLREKIDIHLEQAFFCLYQHPSKKNKISRHLADHNVNPLPLVWERAQQLYEFFCPDALPEFDSYKSISISADLEQLLQRIIALVPTECDPQPLMLKVSDFVHGAAHELPKPLDFPYKVRAAYYLLGDYYFKQNEIGRSVKYFLLDLCINPLRLDTWADLALGYASQLESKLNHCERFKNESEFLDKAKSARVCFQQSLHLSPDHVTLWIEFGSFEYMVHSFCSRVLKYESDTFSMEKFEVLESQKESYLDSSGISFSKALDLHQPEQTEADERWLHHYMIGKVAEKRRKEPVEYLQHYLTAAALLNENNATYPNKIQYHNPQHLSVEALEIHYRIHASILKYLELHEGKHILSTVGKMFKKCLDTSKLYETSTNFAEPDKPEKPSNQEADKDEYPEIVKCVEDLLTEVENKERAEAEAGDRKDVITLSDTDDEKASKPEIELPKVEAKVRVRNVQDIMDDLMRETMAKEQQPMDTDSDGTIIDSVPDPESELKRKEIKEKLVLESTDKIIKKDDETSSVRKSVDGTTTASSTSSDSSSSDSDSDDSSTTSTSTSSDTDNAYLPDSEVQNLVERCLVGLEQCVIRLPQNYKALYRLVHCYFHYKPRKDLTKCKQLLLSEYKCKSGSHVTGLFSEHKTNNFFNGVWRIPSSEIDRPGSLSAHMNRCVTILLQVLRHNNDHKMLLDICLQLKRTPDADKIYIRHTDREQLSEQALSLCIQSLKTQFKNVTSASATQKFLLDVFRAYQRIQKHIPQKESVFAVMLGDIYKKFMQDKLPDNVNVLDLSVKFCQQHKAAEKLKQQQQKQQPILPPVTTPLATISGTPLVLPTPSNVAPISANAPLKRPTIGRPRGRPPGPKQPGLNRSPRGRNPMQSASSLAWQTMMYDQNAMNYMLKYQELLQQYNTISQMNHFQKQFAPQFTHPSTIPSTTQSSLLSPSQLIQTFDQMTSSGMNPLGMSQLTQSLSRLNPSLLKKLVEQCSTPSQPVPTTSWTDELLKQMTSMGGPAKSTLNKPKPSTSQTKPTTHVKATTQMKPTSHIKPTYTTAGYSKSLPSSSFKYSTADVLKSKPQDIPKISSEDKILPPKFSSMQDEYKKAANMLTDRPSITITPVTQTKPSNPLAPPPSTGKTLQEKLADKQKQHSINKNLSFDGKSNEKGPKGWCLTSQGELLHFTIDNILDRLDTPIFEPLREKIDIHLEQAFFCLYQHPSKKNKISRHLADHNVNPLPLVWERAQQLYEFFCPDALPEFDSYKSISISADLEQLLQRIIALVPTECDPQPLMLKVSDFVHGAAHELPKPLDFPYKVRAAYYLLGDYYFKQNEIGRSVKYFLLDLCINPLRLDTWADLALGYASQLESKLNHCERFKNESEFLDKAKSARVCFQQSLHLSPDHVTLWIEFGSFEYMVHSFCSRVLKYESDTFSMEKFEVLESQKESYLDSSGISFSKALDLHQPEQTEADERWLHHYMIGKVAEKRRKEPVEYLQHYLTAAALLNENNATYPNKIQYHNPQHLSVEALEIHYRIHASILKYLELHEGKHILSTVGKMFKKCLDTSKLYETSTNFAEPDKPEKPSNQEADKDEYPEIVKCVEDLLTEVENKERAEAEAGDRKDVITLSDTDDEKASKPEIELPKVEAKVRVRNVQDIMDDLMRETMAKEQQPMDTDSDGTIIDSVPDPESELKRKEIKEKLVLESTDKIIKKDDETSSVRKSVDGTTTASSTSSDSSSSDSDSDDSSTTSTSTSSDTDNAYLPDSEVQNLVERCLVGLEQCVIRLPQNYKALYRLVHCYFHYKPRKDLTKCKQLLLSEYKCKSGSHVTGLFSEHKTNNFFNGVWRIPSSEIDRPGSLSAHMNRCVTILLQVLRHNNDHKMLLDICLQLKRTPDADKIYIRHTDREQLSEQALSLCIQSLKTQFKNVTSASATQKFLLDVFRAYQRIQKHIPQKESVFAVMLGDIYKKFMQDKLPDNVNVLDLSVKFCQQHKAAEKLKQQQQKQQPILPPVTTPLATISGTPLVLPTPSNVAPISANAPLKRPTIGRPRGRPPGPKQPGLNRSPRGRNPMQSASSLAWQTMMYDQNAMNYMLKYQELLQQYNTISQMNHFQKQFAPQFTHPSTIPSTTQSSLLSPSQLIQTFDQMTSSGMNPLGMSQLTQSLSRLNPSLLKKLVEQCSTPSQPVPTTSWTDELLKQMTSMGGPAKSTLNKPKPSTSQTKPTTHVKATTQMKPTSHIKPTYTTAGYSKSLPSSSFKYSTADVLKSKPQDIPKISSEDKILPPKFSSMQDEYKKAANMLTDRPSITITPVTQTKPSNPLAPPPSTGKTLQEKLADKQKQHSINKNLSFDGKSNEKGKSQLTSTFSSPPSSITHVNLPSFPLDSGISISQLPAPKITQSSEIQRERDFGKHKVIKKKTAMSYPDVPTQFNLPPNMPLSVSVIKKTEEAKEKKESSDDDVIIIE